MERLPPNVWTGFILRRLNETRKVLLTLSPDVLALSVFGFAASVEASTL